jgi:hypothetical protein
MGFNIGKAFFPPFVLHVYLAKVRHEKGLFGIGLVGYSQARGSHDTISELDIRMSSPKGGQRWEDGIVVIHAPVACGWVGNDTSRRGDLVDDGLSRP